MLIDRTHHSWAMISAAILTLATGTYLIYAGAAEKGATGGSLPGLIFGILGTAMIVFAGLFAARKKVSNWRLGSAQFWLRGHIWLGTLSFPFILFHSGFAFGGVLEQILMWVFAVVWLSGFHGLAMQHLLPQLLTSRVERETFVAQIPYIRRRNRIMSDRMVSEQCGSIPLSHEPMKGELERLVRHGKKVRDLEAGGRKEEAREEKTRWPDHVYENDLALFRDIATVSKTNGWIRTVNDLTPFLMDIYFVKGVSNSKETASGQTPDGNLATPLDQLRAGVTAKKSGDSPLDAIKAGAKNPGSSPLDAIRAGAKKADDGAKPGASPLDQIRAGVGKVAAPAGALSPIEQLRASAKGASTPSVTQSQPDPSHKPVPNSQFVTNVSVEILSIEELLIKKYGYVPKLAHEVAEYPRPFLRRIDENPDQAVATIASLFVEKYGYDPLLAKEVAELTRPYVGVTADGNSEASAPTSPETVSTSPSSNIDRIRAKTVAGDAPPVAQKEPAKARPPGNIPAPGAIVPQKKTAPETPILRTNELREFYLGEVRPYLTGSPRAGRLASVRESNRAFNQMRGTLPVELHEILSSLQARCDEHRQFAIQERLHHWLHYWLILHVPFSMVFYVLMIVHIVMALRVVPFRFSLF